MSKFKNNKKLLISRPCCFISTLKGRHVLQELQLKETGEPSTPNKVLEITLMAQDQARKQEAAQVILVVINQSDGSGLCTKRLQTY